MLKIIATTMLAGALVTGPLAVVAAQAEDVPMQSAGTAGEHTNGKDMVKKFAMMKKGHHAKK